MGRKTKLTPQIEGLILEGISAGLPMKLVAQYANIGQSTLYQWLARGEKARRGRYRDLAERVKTARAKGVALNLLKIREAGEKDWKALAWLLERTYPELFGRYTRLVIPEKEIDEKAEATEGRVKLRAIVGGKKDDSSGRGRRGTTS